jgi:hypothetical protein
MAASRIHAVWRIVGLGALALALEGCAASREPLSLRIPGLGAKPVLRLAWIDNYPRAVATVAFILEHDLELPRVAASLRFYASREALAEALVSSGYDPAAADRITSTIGALAADGQIVLNEGALAHRPWSHRIAVLAHELTHAVQYQLADGRRGASDQWMREGFSEWVSVRVLERLDITTLPRMRYRQMRHVRNSPHLPPLQTLAKSEEWLDIGVRPGHTAMYPYAFLAVDLLVQQHGTAKVIDYFRLFAFTDDREWAFRTCFGQDVASFERALRARVHPARTTALLRSQP